MPLKSGNAAELNAVIDAQRRAHLAGKSMDDPEIIAMLKEADMSPAPLPPPAKRPPQPKVGIYAD